ALPLPGGARRNATRPLRRQPGPRPRDARGRRPLHGEGGLRRRRPPALPSLRQRDREEPALGQGRAHPHSASQRRSGPPRRDPHRLHLFSGDLMSVLAKFSTLLREKRWARWLAYSAFSWAVFSISLYLTFPSDQVKERLVQAAQANAGI